MRTWYVPLSILDDNRMIAQHREIHTVFGSVMSVKRGYQNHPVVSQYLDAHLLCALDYHELTVKEMRARGWSGHATPLQDELYQLAEQRAIHSSPTRLGDSCGSWDEHVLRTVHTGPELTMHGLAWDMHDLVERWTREEKPLRNTEAAAFVDSHKSTCPDGSCKSRAGVLLAEYSSRPSHTVLQLKGHSSLFNQRA